MTSEFESYKVRVHNVLKQQKNRNSTSNESEVAKQERYDVMHTPCPGKGTPLMGHQPIRSEFIYLIHNITA